MSCLITSWDWENLNIADKEILTLLKKHDSLTLTSETDENLYLFVFISSLEVCIYVQYFFDAVRNQT